jgi:hypothetical protein
MFFWAFKITTFRAIIWQKPIKGHKNTLTISSLSLLLLTVNQQIDNTTALSVSVYTIFLSTVLIVTLLGNIEEVV